MVGFTFQGYTLESLLLAGAILLTLSVLASRISVRFGVPSLLIFLGVGMLAGSEGPGGIEFEDHQIAFAVGSVCLALIIFDGGMRTSWKSVRPILPIGISLSLFGTFITGAVTGIFAHYALGLSWVEALLLGAIVSSTDAAAVFSILRAKGLSLKGTIKQTLEFEAGSNDPVAIFLTMSMLVISSSNGTGAWDFIRMFLLQGGLGLAAGYLAGKGSRWIINHAGIEYEGLYGVLLLGLVAVTFAATSAIGGSGYLAVYVSGLILGNVEMLHKGSISRFIDGIAWIAQIIVFLTLGLLSFPSHLLTVWESGILLALFMMFIARPLSVLIAAPHAKMNIRERVFISWVGLRGAAPIILATLPWSINFAKAEYLFNLVFFIVLISVIAQGISIPWLAKRLGLTVPLNEHLIGTPSAGMLPPGFVSVEIKVKSGSPAEDRQVVSLGLPAGVLLTSLVRSERYIVPRGDTVISADDRIWGLARPSNVETLRQLFGNVKLVS